MTSITTPTATTVPPPVTPVQTTNKSPTDKSSKRKATSDADDQLSKIIHPLEQRAVQPAAETSLKPSISKLFGSEDDDEEEPPKKEKKYTHNQNSFYRIPKISQEKQIVLRLKKEINSSIGRALFALD